MNKLLTYVAIAALSATTSYAQAGFSNGGVSISYGSYNFNDVSTTTIDGFAVFSLSNAFDVQADLNSNFLSTSGGSFTYSDLGYGVHAIYNISNSSRVGAFYNSTSLYEFYDLQSFGLEYQYSSGPIDLEIQAGQGQIFDLDVNFIAASAEYAFGDFSVGAGVFVVPDLDGATASELSINASYTIPSFYNAKLSVEYSTLNFSSFDTGSLIEVGLSIPFGSGNKDPFSDVGKSLQGMSYYVD